MKITETMDNGKVVLAIAERLDTTTAPQLETALLPAFEKSRDVVLDLSALDYVSSAGLRVLLKGQKKATAVGGSMVIKNATDEVKEVFDMTGFMDILTVE
jgi:anti-sigma B factor antagonist